MKSVNTKINASSPTLFDLLFRSSPATRIINLITFYRTFIFPVLVILIFTHQFDVFKWLLVLSFLTDAVDGILARKFNVTSILGARLDSIGDDLTILAGLTGAFVAHFSFIKEQLAIIILMLALFLLQVTMALIRYRKISSFHTYLAKTAAILQGFFLCSLFIFQQPAYWLFYTAAFITTIELIEEIILVMVVPQWKVNVKGLYWVLREARKPTVSAQRDKNHALI